MNPALRCVPGTLCDARLFAPLFARLGGSAEVVPLAGASVGDAADALIEASPRGSVALGFSLGGFVVLEALRRAPDRFAGAVLIASHAEPDTAAAAAERARQATLFAQGSDVLVGDLLPRAVAGSASVAVRGTIHAMAAGFSASDLASQSAIAASRVDSRGLAVDIPILVVAGSEDLMCPPPRSRATADALGATFVLVDAGHFVPLEAPDAVAAALVPWLDLLAVPAAVA